MSRCSLKRQAVSMKYDAIILYQKPWISCTWNLKLSLHFCGNRVIYHPFIGGCIPVQNRTWVFWMWLSASLAHEDIWNRTILTKRKMGLLISNKYDVLQSFWKRYGTIDVLVRGTEPITLRMKKYILLSQAISIHPHCHRIKHVVEPLVHEISSPLTICSSSSTAPVRSFVGSAKKWWSFVHENQFVLTWWQMLNSSRHNVPS